MLARLFTCLFRSLALYMVVVAVGATALPAASAAPPKSKGITPTTRRVIVLPPAVNRYTTPIWRPPVDRYTTPIFRPELDGYTTPNWNDGPEWMLDEYTTPTWNGFNN